MSQSSKSESKRRSRAITTIIKVVGKDFWHELSIAEKNKRIKIQIAKTKKTTKKERQIKKQTTKEIYLSCTNDGHIDYDEVSKICKNSKATFTEREEEKVSWAENRSSFLY